MPQSSPQEPCCQIVNPPKAILTAVEVDVAGVRVRMRSTGYWRGAPDVAGVAKKSLLYPYVDEAAGAGAYRQ